MNTRRFYTVEFSGYIPDVEADSEEHAKKLVASYLHCYTWFTIKLARIEEITHKP